MKKQNYFFTIAFFFLLLVSCRKQPKCNQEEVQKLVIETIKQHISDKVRKDFEEKDFTENENYSYFKPIIESRNKMIDQFEFKINSIRTVDVKKEIKKCDCLGEINSIEKSNDMNLIKDDLIEIVTGDFRIVGISPTIKYTAQITDEEDTYVTIENLQELELFEKNIFAKILYKIREKNKGLISKSIKPSTENYESIDEISSKEDYITPNNLYYIYASANNPVFFLQYTKSER